jgi:hypothetical protein
MVMPGDQTAGQNQNVKTDNNSFARVEQFIYMETTLTYQNSILKKSRTDSSQECLLSFGAEYFVFQFATQKFKDEYILSCNFACCFVWV